MRIKLMLFVLLILIIIFAQSVFALDYTVEVNSPSRVNAYEGDKITDQFSATITNNAGICDITCSWVTSAGSGSGIKVVHDGGSNPFDFDVKAQGSRGIASYTLTITCERIIKGACLLKSPDQRSYGPYSFTYLYSGDGICTTEREKCAAYNEFLKDSACLCPSNKECKPNSNRGADSKGCATFCGNKEVEKQYETCKNCPTDVGKCDGEYCSSASECEGDYCVHRVCSHTPYRKNDGYCDSNVGENCKNSASDCACESYEKCSSAGKCETYCGNDICEVSEQGICKADCQWCGDGVCDESKETCKGCPQDCGECEKTEEEEQVIQQLTQVREEAKVSAQRAQSTKKMINITVGGTMGAIILALIIWAIFKLTKSKKKKPEKRPKKKKKSAKKKR